MRRTVVDVTFRKGRHRSPIGASESQATAAVGIGFSKTMKTYNRTLIGSVSLFISIDGRHLELVQSISNERHHKQTRKGEIQLYLHPS